MLKVKMEGFDELQRNLKRLQDNARRMDGEHRVPVSELLTPAFMQRRTRFGSFDEMVQASPFQVNSAEDFEAIPDAEWDTYVRETTGFGSWQEMLQEAGGEWAQGQLLRGLR